eukprot:g40385.t1
MGSCVPATLLALAALCILAVALSLFALTVLAPPEEGRPRIANHTKDEVMLPEQFELVLVVISSHGENLKVPLYRNVGFDPALRATAVMLHGFPDNALTFSNQMPALHTQGYNVLAPVLRGYSVLNMPTLYRDFTPYSAMLDLLAVLAALELIPTDCRLAPRDKDKTQALHVIGHDWGAVVAQLSVNYCLPGTFSSLSLLSVPNAQRFLSALLHVPRQLVLSWYMFFFQLPFLPERWLAGSMTVLYDVYFPPEKGQNASESRAFQGLHWLWNAWDPAPFSRDRLATVEVTFRSKAVLHAAVQWYRHTIFPMLVPGLPRLLELLGWPEPALAAELLQRPVRAPTLALIGSLDQCIATELFDAANRPEDFPLGLLSRRIEGAGHFLQWSHAARLRALLIAWLREHTHNAPQPQTLK